MEHDLSRYPLPGKFEGGLNIDAWAYGESMNGPDEELGDVESFGWYGLLRGPFKQDDFDEDDDSEYALTDDDIAYLHTCAGCILSENSQGFVSAEWYESTEELESAWSSIEDEYTQSEYEEEYFD